MAGRYRAYPNYKNAESKWLDLIPVHWSRSPLKHLVSIRITDGPHETPDFVDDGVPFLSAEAVKNNALDFEKKRGYIKRELHDIYSKKCLPKADDVFMVKSGNTTGALAMVETEEEFNIWSPLALIRANTQKVLPRFVFYSMQAEFFQTSVQLSWSQGTQPNIGMGVIENLQIAIAALNEQSAIINFLDHETAKIDTLIDRQQQLIKLLKEKRQAVISHAVTKGLNHEAPMRDSGVEWLGEVPEHWEVRRLKHISPKVGVGLVINPSTYTKDEGVYFIFGGDVKEYGFDLSKTRRIAPEDSDNLLPSRLNHRDLVCIRVGYPGVTAVVPQELEGANCASVIVIRRGEYNSEWLCAAMNMWIGRQQVERASYGAAQKQFNVADAIEFIFSVPPKQEQDEIAYYVEQTLARFNTLSGKAEKQIGLLQERRTALISAAVTGKIDVRNWQAPIQNQTNKEEAA